jgi:hypothetical protein
MLHKETVERKTFELLVSLMQDENLSNFALVGGTNLAMSLGHRESIDLDLFANQPFDAEILSDYLIKTYKFEPITVLKNNTATGIIDGVKIDMLAFRYPLLQPLYVSSDGIRMYSIEDVAAMKLSVISDNGTRIKDFVDIAYLSTKMPLCEMLAAYEKKYNSDIMRAMRGLVYFTDINFSTVVTLTNNKKFSWKKIEKRIYEMVKDENKIFETEPI